MCWSACVPGHLHWTGEPFMNRDFILNEIRRTAEANGGIPLGRRRFLKETGIKVSDWAGKHWVRWGDALREAGFQANVLQSSYTDDFVLGQFADVLVSLDRIPTVLELKLRTREDPNFPSHNTFGRFGTKADLLAHLHAYCLARPELKRAAELTVAYANQGKDANAESSKPSDLLESFGTVYLIKSGKYYKIGRTNALGRRERDLAIQLPDKAKTIHSIQTDDPVGIEAYWHRRFAARRKNGEWFELSAEEVSAFCRRKFM